MNASPALDVSRLDDSTVGHRSPIWWGNVLLMAIETTMFALLVATYFYLWMNYEQWPPPRVNTFPAIFDPVPGLGISVANLLVMLVSVVPMYWVDQACVRRDERTVKIGLLIVVALCATSSALRFVEFRELQFRWDDNAYASTIWTVLGMHLMHLLTGTCELGLMCVWVFAHGLDIRHARDIRATGLYWYWVVAIWVLLFAMVYITPRVK
jgi:cytochrome c oxidase subunit III